MAFKFIEGGSYLEGRVEVWEEPHPGRTYSLGLDFAFGLKNGDFDAGVLLRDDGEQVATLHGRWGERFGVEVVWPLVSWYGRANVFVVGEPTATGVPILRYLLDQGCWLYYHRAEATRGRPIRDQLGHTPGRLDITIQWLRRDLRGIGNRKLVIRDKALFDEMVNFQFLPKGGKSLQDSSDSQLTWGGAAGFHDDLVRALAYANAGLEWLPAFEPPAPEMPVGSFGKMLGYDKLFYGGAEAKRCGYFEVEAMGGGVVL